MDDENTKGLLVGYSLFLEQVASRQRNHSSSSIAPLRFRHDGANPYRTTEDVVKLFLDSMSLLLVSQPGNDYITACTLDHESGVDSGAKIGEKRKASANFEASSQEKNVRSNVEQHVPGPASILKPTLALRIARNGVFTVNANAQFKAHAKNIVQFVCHGNVKESRWFLNSLLTWCHKKIKHCINGSKLSWIQLQSVLRKLKSPKGGKVPGFYPHLQGMKYGNGLFTYTEETSSDAYNNMVKILGWVVERALELPKNWVNPRSVVQGAYLFREKKFFMNLLKLSLPDDADFECVRGLLEKLSSYEVAIIQLRYVIAARAKNHSDIFLRNVEVQLCNPIVQSFPAPKFKELCKSAMGPEKLSRLEVPDDIIATYEKTRRRVKIQEHCEVQLARFLIENPARTQVVAYFGVSNNSCFLCSRLLEAFRNPHIPGDLHEFAVRGSHGEIYGRWRPILDPAAPDSTVQRFELCHADLLRDVTAQFNDEVDRYLALPIRPRLPEVAR